MKIFSFSPSLTFTLISICKNEILQPFIIFTTVRIFENIFVRRCKCMYVLSISSSFIDSILVVFFFVANHRCEYVYTWYNVRWKQNEIKSMCKNMKTQNMKQPKLKDWKRKRFYDEQNGWSVGVMQTLLIFCCWMIWLYKWWQTRGFTLVNVNIFTYVFLFVCSVSIIENDHWSYREKKMKVHV